LAVEVVHTCTPAFMGFKGVSRSLVLTVSPSIKNLTYRVRIRVRVRVRRRRRRRRTWW